MSRQRLTELGGYLRQYWRSVGAYCLGAAIALLIIVQLALPWNNLPLYQTIDGVMVGGQDITATTKKLDARYATLPVDLYFGNSPKVYRQPKTSDVGLTVSTKSQVESAMYPWWLRLVPTSLWWAHNVITISAPSYKHDAAKVAGYMSNELGQSCDIKAVNASLEYKDKKLRVISAIDGGTCKLDDVKKLLSALAPRLTNHDLRIPMVQHPAKIHDEIAQAFGDKLMANTKDGMPVKTGSQTVTALQTDLLSWLDFASPDTGLVTRVNATRANDFLTKQLSPKISVAAGTSYVTTQDFTETERTDGPSGQTLDTDATVATMNNWLADASNQPIAKAKAVAPTVVYKRSYTPTDTGFSALFQQFAQAHSGTFGISYAELDGQHRHASFNDTKIFQTASTYKLFIAYSTLKRIESGQWHWTDQITGGKDATRCFNDMIKLSDNACAEAFLGKIGYKAITNEIHAAGLGSSSFLTDYIQSTPADLVTYLGALQSGQLLSPSSTSTLIGAMKQNIYRQGIPAGANGTVADKVGFLNPGSIQGVPGTVNLLHDAAIVYDAKGTFVLAIMTGNSSWNTIADLTRQVENLRSQG
jgi:beta-lactamase class A